MKKEIRIIVLFGSPFLYGSEKANIDVFSALAEYEHVKILFLIDGKRGKDIIKPYLNEKSLTYVSVPYHFLLRKNMNIKEWIEKLFEILAGSYQLLKCYYKFKPTHLYTSKQEYFLNFFPVLFFLRIPIIYRIGDSPVLHNILYRKLWSYMVKKMFKIICVSKFIARQVELSGAKKSKIDVIYSRPHDRKTSISLSKGDTFEVLYVGQITKHKGLDLFIEAAINLSKKYQNINFSVAGNIDKHDQFSQEQINIVNKASFSNRIKFLGYVSNVDKLYSYSNLHICPSVYDEPLANVLIDAKKHAIPSIIFNVGGLPEIIEHQINGYICSNKTALCLEKAIEQYYMHKDICIEHGKNALDSLSKLEIDNFKQRWLNVFEN